MNIKWHKNRWYWAGHLFILIIIALAVFSVFKHSVGFLSAEGKITILSSETFYRLIFNPLWILVLWFYEKGRGLNYERHDDILQNIQGALDATHGKHIKRSDLFNMVYKHDDAPERLEKGLQAHDTVKSSTGKPRVN
ncbi:hypothetical protein KKC91_04250 [bacterium]|nr:hypothetical protein [bacterium]